MFIRETGRRGQGKLKVFEEMRMCYLRSQSVACFIFHHRLVEDVIGRLILLWTRIRALINSLSHSLFLISTLQTLILLWIESFESYLVDLVILESTQQLSSRHSLMYNLSCLQKSSYFYTQAGILLGLFRGTFFPPTHSPENGLSPVTLATDFSSISWKWEAPLPPEISKMLI